MPQEPQKILVREAVSERDVLLTFRLAEEVFGVDSFWSFDLEKEVVEKFPGGLHVLEVDGHIAGYYDIYGLTESGFSALRKEGERGLDINSFACVTRDVPVYLAGIVVAPSFRAWSSHLLIDLHKRIDAIAEKNDVYSLAYSPEGERVLSRMGLQRQIPGEQLYARFSTQS